MSQQVLIISSEFPPGPGGIGQHAFYLAKFLKNDRDVLVLTNRDYASLQLIHDFDKRHSIPVVRFVRFGFLTPLLRFSQLVQCLMKFKPRSIIFTGLFPLWLLPFSWLLAPSARRLAIVHGHEPIFGSRLSRLWTKLAFGYADNIIPVSKFAASNVSPLWFQDNRICIIPNGIDSAELTQWQKSLSKELDSFGSVTFQGGFPVLLTVGHTSRRKGQHNVIQALPLLKQTFPDVKYYCVGRDVHNKDLKKLAESLEVSGQVIFVPPCSKRSELGLWYRKADVFMLLSENQPNGDVEGFGIVALEANFFGVPVIGARGCGVEDAVRNKYSGLLVDYNDPYEVVRAVSAVLDDSGGYAERSRKHAMEYDWNRIGVKVLELIH